MSKHLLTALTSVSFALAASSALAQSAAAPASTSNATTTNGAAQTAAAATTQKAGLTRAQVQAEYLEARKNGTLIETEADMDVAQTRKHYAK